MTYKEIKNIVKKLRKQQTESEIVLWNELRNRKLDGFKFLRQHPIVYENNKNNLYFFIPDFYCSELKFAIELDGRIHDFTKEKDYNRDMILKEKGIRTIRLKNDEINEIERIKDMIRKFITHP